MGFSDLALRVKGHRPTSNHLFLGFLLKDGVLFGSSIGIDGWNIHLDAGRAGQTLVYGYKL